MPDPSKAVATQLANIEKRTGKSLAELKVLVQKSGLSKHGEIRDMLTTKLGLGYGDANALAHAARQADGSATPPAAGADSGVDLLYSGAKAPLLPIHNALMSAVQRFGDFEVAPKKTYLSLRRKKQFAMVGPATKTQVEVGINAENLPSSGRLKVRPPNSMCTYTCRLSDAGEVDAELLGWIRTAFDAAG